MDHMCFWESFKGTVHPQNQKYIFILLARELFISLDRFGERFLPSLGYNGSNSALNVVLTAPKKHFVAVANENVELT